MYNFYTKTIFQGGALEKLPSLALLNFWLQKLGLYKKGNLVKGNLVFPTRLNKKGRVAPLFCLSVLTSPISFKTDRAA